jgi:hypothetical protein
MLTGVLQFIALAGNLCVPGVRREINLTRPRHGTIVNKDLLKELLIPQRCESAGQLFFSQLNAPPCRF